MKAKREAVERMRQMRLEARGNLLRRSAERLIGEGRYVELEARRSWECVICGRTIVPGDRYVQLRKPGYGRMSACIFELPDA